MAMQEFDNGTRYYTALSTDTEIINLKTSGGQIGGKVYVNDATDSTTIACYIINNDLTLSPFTFSGNSSSGSENVIWETEQW